MGKYIWGIGGPILVEKPADPAIPKTNNGYGNYSDLYKAGENILLNAGENAGSAAEAFFNNMSPEERARFVDSVPVAPNAGTTSPPTYGEIINTNGSSEGVSPTLSTTPEVTEPVVPETPTAPTTTVETPSQSTEPDSYEKWLADSRTTAEANKQSILAGIENKRLDAHKDAETVRERSIVDARTNYQQGLAGYGANAEALGAMGLTNSGYSDYLNANAYAQRRSDIQAAKATETAVKKEADRLASDQKLSTETTYNEFLSGLDEKAATYATKKEEKAKADADAAREAIDTAYYDLFDSAKSGDYTPEEIKALAIRNGLNETDANYLAGIAGTAIDEKSKADSVAHYTELLAGANTGAYTVEQIEQLASNYGLSEPQKQSLIAAVNAYITKQQSVNNSALYGQGLGTVTDAVNSGAISPEQGQQHHFDYYKDIIQNSFDGVNDAEILAAYNNGNMSEPQYKSLRQLWNSEVDTSKNQFVNDDGTIMSKQEAESHLKKIAGNLLCDDATKQALKDVFADIYTVSTGNVKNKSGSLKEYEDEGNNFLVTVGEKSYDIESGGETEDATVIAVASNLFDGVFFSYKGKYYIKEDGRVFEIRKKPTGSSKKWKEFTKAF